MAAALASFVSTSLLRGWKPQIFVRLVLQLQDNADLGTASELLETVVSIINERETNPMLYEYFLMLSIEPKSIFQLRDFIAYIAENSVLSEQNHLTHFTAYIARSKLVRMEDIEPYYEKLQALASTGHAEIQMLLNTAVANKPMDTAKITEVANHAAPDPASRVVWLEWMLSTGQSLDDIDAYLNVLWHGDRESVICYEFIMTAFEVLSMESSKEFPLYYSRCVLFIKSKLPLILQRRFAMQSLDDSSKLEALENVIPRVFATMDKDVMEKVEYKCPGICSKFGTACLKLKLCTSDALSPLAPLNQHSDSSMQKDISNEITSGTFNSPIRPMDLMEVDEVTEATEIVSIQNVLNDPVKYIPQIGTLDVKSIDRVSHELVYACHGSADTVEPITIQKIVKICGTLISNPNILDLVFVHASPYVFCLAINKHVEKLSEMEGSTEGSNASIYEIYTMLGTLLAFMECISSRLNMKLPSGWSRRFLKSQTHLTVPQILNFDSLERLGDLKTTCDNVIPQLSKWVVALFNGSGGNMNITPDLLKPFNELSIIIPIVVRQAVWAYRSAVIDKEALKKGMDYFINLLPAILFVPLVLRILVTDYVEGKHQSTTLECAQMLLQSITLQPNLTPVTKYFVGLEVSKLAEVSGSKDIMTFAEKINPEFTKTNQEIKSVQKAKFEGGDSCSLLDSLQKSTTELSKWNSWPHGIPPTFTTWVLQSKGIIKFNKLVLLVPSDLHLALLLINGFYKLSSSPYIENKKDNGTNEELKAKLEMEIALANKITHIRMKKLQELQNYISEMSNTNVSYDFADTFLSVSNEPESKTAENTSAVAADNNNTVEAKPNVEKSSDQQYNVSEPALNTEKLDLYDEFVNRPMDLADLDMAISEWE